MSLEYVNQSERSVNLRCNTYVEDEGTPEVFGVLTEGLLGHVG